MRHGFFKIFLSAFAYIIILAGCDQNSVLMTTFNRPIPNILSDKKIDLGLRDYSNAKSLSVDVESNEFSEFKFSFLTSGAGECSTASYDKWRPVGSSLEIGDLGADGLKKLCLITRKSKNSMTTMEYVWTKDTVAPSKASFANTPTGTTSSTAMSVKITANEAATYRYAVVLNSQSCANATLSDARAIDREIEQSVTEDGTYKLCVLTYDLALNPSEEFSETTWTVLSEVPTATLVGVFTGTSPDQTLNVTVSSTTAIAYRYAIADSTTNCVVAVFGSWVALSQTITDNLGANGTKALCVKVKNLVGTESSIISAGWTKNSSTIVAALSGTPASASSASSLNITVSGTDVSEYAYALNTPSTNCSSVVFTTWINVSVPITDNLGADGSKQLCVVGRANASNTQLAANATVYAWTKDTAKPTAADISLAGTPADPSGITNLNVTVSGSSGIVSYKFALTTSGTNCVAATYSGAWVAISTPITAAVGVDANKKRLCVIAKDAAENFMVDATDAGKVFDWLQDSTKPIAADITLTGLPADPSNLASLNVTVGGTDVASYQYALTTDVTSCTSATYNGTWIATTTLITANTGVDSNKKRLCVIAKDTAGNEMVGTSDTAKSHDWKQDGTPATLTIVSVLSPSTIGGALSEVPSTSLTFSANEAVNYSLNEGSTVVASGAVAASTSLVLTFAASNLNAGDGLHSLLLTVTDAAGNTTSSSQSVTVDTTAPSHITNFDVVRDDNVNLYKLTWTSGLTATDKIKLVKVTGSISPATTIAGGTVQGSALAYNTTSTTVDTGSESIIAWRAFTCDAVGNCNETACASCSKGVDASLVLQNKSEADTLSASWSGKPSGAIVRIAYSKSKTDLLAWNGTSTTLTNSVVMVDGDANCLSGTSCLVQFSNNTTDPAWTRRYFRVSSSVSGQGVFLGDVRYWAKVPAGMIFVAKEDWPLNEYGQFREVATDFAIDRYEAYATTTATNPGGNAGSAAYPNAYNAVLKSDTGQSPTTSLDWYRTKQGCFNRTLEPELSSFIVGTSTTLSPRRQVHLATNLESFVAAFGTPDGVHSDNTVCRISTGNGSHSATGANTSCISRYGAYDLIGNANEHVDMFFNSFSGAGPYTSTATIYKGTSFEIVDSVTVSGPSYVAGIDFKKGLPNIASGSPVAAFKGDRVQLSTGAARGLVRGGDENNGNFAGRFEFGFHNDPSFQWWETGGRCALAAPAPRLIKVTNDSEGQKANFFWNADNFDAEVTGLGAVEVFLAIGSNQEEINNWDGTPTTSFVGGGIIKFTTDGSGNQVYDSTTLSGLTCGTYTPNSSGYSGSCSIDLSAAPLNLSPWQKRFVKIFARNWSIAESASHGAISSTYGVGYVPTGMVLVAKENWPVENLGSTLGFNYKSNVFDGITGPFDYAIDKYEIYETTTAINVGGNAGSAAYPNAYNSVLLSASGQSPKVSLDWYRFKQGCENRTTELNMASFIGNSTLARTSTTADPRRRVHLATDTEWFVAAYGTLDASGATNCNNDSRGTPFNSGTSNTANCISHYGVLDTIGNVSEWTDSHWSNIVSNSGVRTTFYGTGASYAINDASFTLPTATNYVSAFDFTKHLPTSSSASAIYYFMLDHFVLGTGNIASHRGGSWSLGADNGRFSLNAGLAPSSASASTGGRCAIAGP